MPKGSPYSVNILINYRKRDHQCSIEFTHVCHIRPRILFLLTSSVATYLLAVARYSYVQLWLPAATTECHYSALYLRKLNASHQIKSKNTRVLQMKQKARYFLMPAKIENTSETVVPNNIAFMSLTYRPSFACIHQHMQTATV
jgi:hypothetical protein